MRSAGSRKAFPARVLIPTVWQIRTSSSLCFFFSSRRRHTRYWRDWSSDVCSSDLVADGETLAVAGSPRVVHTPGHTFGHCALHLPDRDVLITGDALITRSPYSPD